MKEISKSAPIGHEASLKKLIETAKRLGCEDDPAVVKALSELRTIDTRKEAELDIMLTRLGRMYGVPYPFPR